MFDTWFYDAVLYKVKSGIFIYKSAFLLLRHILKAFKVNHFNAASIHLY